MEGAVQNGVPGIDALLGGGCSCGTCHVYVDVEWLGATGMPNEPEQERLELCSETGPTSRLSCQIEVTDKLNGLIVRLPRGQG